MKLASAAFASLIMLGFAHGAEPLPILSKQGALRAVELFRKDPLSDLGRGAGGLLMHFAEKSTEVEVRLAENTVPFLSNKIPIAERSTLTAAYVAGNVDAQLRHNQTRNDTYAGLVQVIATYRQMQKRDAKVRVAEVEELIELEKRGELKKYAGK